MEESVDGYENMMAQIEFKAGRKNKVKGGLKDEGTKVSMSDLLNIGINEGIPDSKINDQLEKMQTKSVGLT